MPVVIKNDRQGRGDYRLRAREDVVFVQEGKKGKKPCTGRKKGVKRVERRGCGEKSPQPAQSAIRGEKPKASRQEGDRILEGGAQSGKDSSRFWKVHLRKAP